jgi:hypothetical protein
MRINEENCEGCIFRNGLLCEKFYRNILVMEDEYLECDDKEERIKND